MLNVSENFRIEMQKNSKVSLEIIMTLADSDTQITIPGKYVVRESAKIEDAVTSSGSFDIGAAIINKFTVSFRNEDGFFDDRIMEGAKLYPRIGKELSDGTTEWVNKGVFIVDSAKKVGKTIQIEALDNLSKLEGDYANVKTEYPATLNEIIRDICTTNGVELEDGRFSNDYYVVKERPKESGVTCLQMLSYAMQITGLFARCNNVGKLVLGWYSEVDPEEANHKITKLTSSDIQESDVIITGIKVVDSGEENNEFTRGDTDYLLTIDSNPLIEAGKAESVAMFLGTKMIGLRFRPLSASCLADPTIEAGDSARVIDRNGNDVFCYINSLTYSVGGYTNIACEAKNVAENRIVTVSNATKAATIARQEANKKIEKYNNSIQQLTSLITQSFGVFKTEETLSDGSVVYYMHDKPTLDESIKIWKMTADAFAVSSDGGKTWNAGMDADGNVAVNVLSAIGIKADWIETGVFSVVDDYGNTIFQADKDTGTVTSTIVTEQGTLSGIINGKKLEFKYTDINNEVLSGIYFDFEEGVFKFDGSGNFTGSLNVADKFIVDVFGNAKIYGGKYYAMDEDGNVSSYTSMDKNGFIVYAKSGQEVIRLGFPEGDSSYPYIKLRSLYSDEEAGAIVKKFSNGLWVGNDAPENAFGTFFAQEEYNGIFISTEDGKTYVVNGTDMQNIYTGESIARFG